MLLNWQWVSFGIFSQTQIEQYSRYFRSNIMMMFNQEHQRWHAFTSITRDRVYELMFWKSEVPTRKCMHGNSDKWHIFSGS
jgi:hypothetical protein